MNDNLILILAILVSAGIGAYIGMIIAKLKNKSDQGVLKERQNQLSLTIDELKTNINKVELEREAIRREKEYLSTELSRKTTEYDHLIKENEKRDEVLKKQQEQLRKDFELLANNILEEKSTKFAEHNKEQLKRILSPLQEKIQTFEKKVEDTQKESFT